MKTIIQGNLEKIKEYKYFDCSYCGWAGKADKTEYEKYEDSNKRFPVKWKVQCPCCHNIAYLIENEEILKRIIREEDKIGKDYWENR